MVFDAWIPTDHNPADDPSGWYGVRCTKIPQPRPLREVVLSSPPSWSVRERLVLLLCSGPRRVGDVGHFVEEFAADAGLVLKALHFDPVVSEDRDLLNAQAVQQLCVAAEEGHIVGALSSPPCSPFSRARRRALPGGGGPRPLRSRARPLEPLPGLTQRERLSCLQGTHLALACLEIIARVAWKGGWAGN